MQGLLQRQYLFRASRVHLPRAVGMSLMLALVLCGTALGQARVSGLVTTADGVPIQGVVVGVQQTQLRTTTNVVGRYEITASPGALLIFSAIGYRPLTVNIADRTRVDVIMEAAVAVLDAIVVTGYTEQRRADITGAVSGVDMESVQKQSSTSVLQRLDGRVPGVTVDASGSPGSRTTVRIRGASSFQNNDPLYVIDGTPVEDTYINWLNPRDIASIQVLKDASAASIYGSRATNGVVVIETRKSAFSGRGSEGPQFSLDVRTGIAAPVRGYDDILILDALEYFQIVKQSYENAGLPVPANIYGDPNNPTVPAYIWPNNGVDQTTTVDEDSYSFPNNLIMPGSAGTNWWKAVFSPALVSDANLGLSGGGATYGYNVSFNYLNQEGTAAYNRFQRAGARVNTQFEHGRLTVGENLAVAREQYYGGMGDPDGYAEDGIMGKNILMQPVVPIYDIGGNFAAGKAVGLGNQANPLKRAWGNKDDVGTNLKIFGNVFAGYALTNQLRLNTRFGVNLNEQTNTGYTPIDPELSEPSFSNGINENYGTFREWTWTNTLRYATTFGGRHTVDVLLGQEANRNRSRFNASSINNLLTTDINARYIQDFVGDPLTKNVNSSGGTASLLSFFGKVDYNFADRYYLSGTLRRDGSSRLGPNSRWGTFPAFSLGWRLSQEPFFPQNGSFTNVMLRFGYGVTGNQSIPAGRIVSQFGGDRGDTYYAIDGGNAIAAGFRQTSLGNPDLKWESNTSANLGLDLEFLRGAASLVVDLYQRSTDNLLFDPATPGTAGVAAPPIVNIGKMKNTGIDFSLGYTGTIGAGSWSVSFNGSHYKNKIVRIDGVQDFFYGPVSTRYGNQVINQVGYPIGSFYGLVADGFFEDDAAVAAHATQDGAAPGRIRFQDQLTVDTDGDGVPDQTDGVINAEDRTIIGSPHPDFTAGLDFTLQMGAFDFSATVFGTFGNEIWDVQKEFYVFRNFSTNVRKDLLTDSWEPGKTDAKYPRLDQNDTFSGQQLSSYYVEDGSYIRLRTLQVGYRVPQKWIPNTRVYVQAENMFTLTGYSGLDPALPAASLFGAAGDIRDQYRGVDRGAYPSNKTISFGINTKF
jgi:TonB-dependent starch-binding outer membrane protein SusC